MSPPPPPPAPLTLSATLAPPLCPQIELVFSKIKHWLRRHGDWATAVGGYRALDAALRAVTADDCLGYVKVGDFYLNH